MTVKQQCIFIQRPDYERSLQLNRRESSAKVRYNPEKRDTPPTVKTGRKSAKESDIRKQRDCDVKEGREHRE